MPELNQPKPSLEKLPKDKPKHYILYIHIYQSGILQVFREFTWNKIFLIWNISVFVKTTTMQSTFFKKVDFLIFHKKSKKMAVTHKEDFFHTPIFNRKIFILKSFFKSMQEYVVTKSLSGKTNSQAWKKCQRSFTHWNLLQTWSGQEYWGFKEAANNCCGFNVNMLIRML